MFDTLHSFSKTIQMSLNEEVGEFCTTNIIEFFLISRNNEQLALKSIKKARPFQI